MEGRNGMGWDDDATALIRQGLDWLSGCWAFGGLVFMLFLFNAMISFSIFSLVVKSVLVNGHHNENKSAMEVVLKSSPTSCFNVLHIRRTL